MFLSSAFGRYPVLAGPAHRDVRVAAQRALLHVAVRDADRLDRRLQQREEPPRGLGRAQVGLGHDLEQRRAAAVEVDDRAGRARRCARRRRPRGSSSPRPPRGARARAARPRSPSGPATVSEPPRHRGSSYWLIWYAFGESGIEVVLAVEDRALGDLRAERDADEDRLLDRCAVRHRQHAGVRRADRADARVRLAARDVLAAAEHLRARVQLHVDLEADHGLPALGHRAIALTPPPPRAAAAPGRTPTPARARGRRRAACSPRTPGRSAAGRPAGRR